MFDQWIEWMYRGFDQLSKTWLDYRPWNRVPHLQAKPHLRIYDPDRNEAI